jgi:hypothetical protein
VLDILHNCRPTAGTLDLVAQFHAVGGRLLRALMYHVLQILWECTGLCASGALDIHRMDGESDLAKVHRRFRVKVLVVVGEFELPEDKWSDGGWARADAVSAGFVRLALTRGWDDLATTSEAIYSYTARSGERSNTVVVLPCHCEALAYGGGHEACGDVFGGVDLDVVRVKGFMVDGDPCTKTFEVELSGCLDIRAIQTKR